MFNFWRKKSAATPAILEPVASPNRQGLNKAGIIVTNDLEVAIERCRHKVQRIAKDCRKHNRRFRDPEFDFSDDKDKCLHGILFPDSPKYDPSDVLRAGEIFEDPKFFINGATASDISQGNIGDCWFLSGLSLIATAGLVEKICVERDEQVGVYGFVFWRDAGWVDVIIDDLLFVKIPKWREVDENTRMMFKNDQDAYMKQARKGNKILYFSKSATENETWVPLLEKAYAKLHGDFAALNGGFTHEGVEDLSGAVSNRMFIRDILDPEYFWNEELLKANQDRFFACSIANANAVCDDGRRRSDPLNGLVAQHAYSVINAMEYKGVKFVKIRNPWGDYEWRGRWSDGSKEWTGEWLEVLKALDYGFGNDGEFLMEYSDFLKTWDIVERCRLFDENWALSQLWLQVSLDNHPRTTNFGDVSFTINFSKPTSVVLMLSQVDTRYFLGVANPCTFSLRFLIFKCGEKEPIASSFHDALWRRSVNVELDLEAGDYVVHVKIDRIPPYIPPSPFPEPDPSAAPEASSNTPSYIRKDVQKRTEQLISASVASNFRPRDYFLQMPLSEDLYHGIDLTSMEVAMYDLLSQFNAKTKAAFAAIEDKKKDSTGEKDVDIMKEEEEEEGSSVDGEREKIENTIVSSPVHKGASQKDGTNKRPTGEFGDAKSSLSSTGITKQDTKETLASQTLEASSISLEADTEQHDDNIQSQIKSPSKEDEDKPSEVQVNPQTESKPSASPVQVFNVNPKGPEAPSSPEPPNDLHEEYCSGHKGSITGPRYHCLDVACPNYDLCENCMKKGIHNPEHQMLEIKEPYNGLGNNTALSTSSDVVTVGLKVYASKDCEVNIRGQLRHGDLIRDYVLMSRII